MDPAQGGFEFGFDGVPGTDSFLEFYDDYLGTGAATMDADYPNGAEYCFNIFGGTAGTLQQCETGLGTENYGNIPYLTGGKFTELNTLDVTKDFTVTIPTPAASVTNVIVEVYTDDGNEDTVFYNTQTGGGFLTSIVIPAGTLTKGVDYGLFLEFGNASDPDIAGGDISPTGGSKGYNSGTDMLFTPTGPPAAEYRLLKFRDYAQNSDDQPTEADLVGFFGALILTDASQLSEWTLTVDGGEPPMGRFDGGYDGTSGVDTFLEYFADYAASDQSILDGDYPSDTTEFCFNISGGDAGTLQQCETGLGAENYAVVPYLTGSQYSELSSIDVSMPHTFTFNTPTGPGEVTNVHFEIYLDDEDETSVFSVNQNIVDGLPYETSLEMPADTLQEGVAYSGFIEFATAIAGGTGAISPNNTNSKGHNVATDFAFTVPEPGMALSQFASLLTLLGVVRFRRMRSLASR